MSRQSVIHPATGTYNRTIEELKFEIDYEINARLLSYNRTIEELKYGRLGGWQYPGRCL